MSKFRWTGEEPRYLAGENRQKGDEFEVDDPALAEDLRGLPGVEELGPEGPAAEAAGEDAPAIPGTTDEAEAASLSRQINLNRLADFILSEFPNEPGSQGYDEGVVDVAIRLLGRLKALESTMPALPGDG